MYFSDVKIGSWQPAENVEIQIPCMFLVQTDGSKPEFAQKTFVDVVNLGSS